MNDETGQVYRGRADIEAARRRGEPLVPVSEEVATTMERAFELREKHPSLFRRKLKLRKPACQGGDKA